MRISDWSSDVCSSDLADVIGKAGPQLKLIANFGNGVDHIDPKAARAKGIVVTNTPGVLTEDTADMTMALILSVPRRLAEGVQMVLEGEWKGWSPCHMLGHRITGKRLGIRTEKRRVGEECGSTVRFRGQRVY